MKNANKKTVATVSKVQSLLTKEGIKFCEEIGLSIRPSAKLGVILAYLKKRGKGFKVGEKVDFEKIGSDSIGRKERAFFEKFAKVSFSPLSYKIAYDKKGKKTGNNFKEYTKAEVVKV